MRHLRVCALRESAKDTGTALRKMDCKDSERQKAISVEAKEFNGYIVLVILPLIIYPLIAVETVAVS